MTSLLPTARPTHKKLAFRHCFLSLTVNSAKWAKNRQFLLVEH